MHTGDPYNARLVEDTVTQLNETAGLFGYAFADVRPRFERSRENLTMSVTFQVAEAPRVYVERININGNTATRDKVIRREFRLAEGDPFNSVRVKRSRDRIQSLGFFQENLEITQEQGSGPDRVVLGVGVEERATGELQFSAGFSSLERFLVNLSVRQRNFRGLGQELRDTLRQPLVIVFYDAGGALRDLGQVGLDHVHVFHQLFEQRLALPRAHHVELVYRL
jgi:outer membrane protein insertion porin family